MAEKYIRFALDNIEFPNSDYDCANDNEEREFTLLNSEKHGSRIMVRLSDAVAFAESLKEMSVELTYEDVRIVFKEYADVLKRSRKRGMRGFRNFTGKVEDEIRGKLAELGLAKFCSQFGVIFNPDFRILEQGQLRDEGDFLDVSTTAGTSRLPAELVVAVKSTLGYFAIAVPENEWTWPGGVYIAVRLHIEDDFLLRIMNKALGLENFDLTKIIGWLEVLGYITKHEMEQHAFVGRRLPGKYHSAEADWNRRNYIMHSAQLYHTRRDFANLMERYRNVGIPSI